MTSYTTATAFSELLDQLVSEAVGRDVPIEIAREARIATTNRLAIGPGDDVSPSAQLRARAYFGAVVRRRVVRRGVPARAAARFVVASVVEDLRSSGREPTAIWHELERGWAQAVPREILEEYRLRLCG